MTEQFLLPDVGEGLTEAEIVAWKVKVGDEVAVNQVLVEIETAKSLVELPSPFSGTVVDVLVDEGQTVDVGTAIITVQAGAGSIGSEVPAIPAHPAQERAVHRVVRAQAQAVVVAPRRVAHVDVERTR
ncbi:biotin/lipoyl-containing protein, partial [Rathayibacter sp. AY2B5]|uniref:biotin/lipoyl-containing protein n=1 Tax=Rathayibacter sp. AY2B5 TaxID=2080570 RepID=UPI000D48D8A4